MRQLDNVFDAINAVIQANLADYAAVYYGQAVLQERDGLTFPIVKIGAREGQQISPIDTQGLQFYHRVIDHGVDEDSGKGSAVYAFHNYECTLVAVGHRGTVEVDFDNDDQANTVMNILGSNPKIGNAIIQVTGRPETEKSEVLGVEYAGNEKITKKVLDLYAFAINYDLKLRGTGGGCSL